jgi:hypothetical protein
MRVGLLGSLVVGWLAGAGFVTAQTLPPPAPVAPVILGRPVALVPAAGSDSSIVRTSAVVIGSPIAETPNAPRGPIYRGAIGDPLTGPGIPPGATVVPPPVGPPPVGPPPVVPPPLPPPPITGGTPPGVPTVPSAPTGERFWFTTEYLLWWVKDGRAPPPPTPINVPAGVDFTGITNTAVAAGAGGNFNYGTFSGLRLSGGAWIDCNRIFGAEGSFLFLERRSDSRRATAAVPAFAAFGLPPSIDGVAINSNTQLWGFEANGLFSLAHDCSSHLELIGGFRNLNVAENLSIAGLSTTNVNGVLSTAAFQDSFRTQNFFYGPQIGARGGVHFGKFSADLTAKLAMGVTSEFVTVNGARVVNNGGAVTTALGGFYAEPTNIGRRNRNEFAVVPEATLQVGYNFTQNIKVFVGYTFLYISSVARPGDQVDPVINVSQIVPPAFGPARPLPIFRNGDYWAQGLNFGVEFTY